VLRSVGVMLVAPEPDRSDLVVRRYRTALDQALSVAAATPGARLLVGGISLGAQVAASWAAERLEADPDLPIAGLLLALPAWSGPPEGAPAAAAARATAMTVRAQGLDAAIAAARAGSPAWLADELQRAWRGYGPALADVLDAAASAPGPTPGSLGGLDVPVGVAALRDDPVHPLAVARSWTGLLPRAALVTSRLDVFGADPGVLGRAAVLGWLRARG
jgi:pimeloyl-ACP methyl ester carboxylesterase